MTALIIAYIGTTAYVWYDSIKTWKEMDKRLKKDGYRFIKKKKYVLGDTLFLILGSIALSLPIFHLIFPIMNHNKDSSYDNYKNYLEEAGSIELIEPSENTSYFNEKLKKVTGIGYISGIENTIELARQVEEAEKKKTITIGEDKLEERINRNGHIYYSPVTKEDDTLDGGFTYKKTLK